MLVPTGYTVQDLSPLIYSKNNPTPQRTTAKVTVRDAASFVRYYEKFAEESSVIFSSETELQLFSILDYHQSASSPKWREHTLKLSLQHSGPWQTWTGKNNSPFTQMAFAEFLEQNAVDIIDPKAADIVEIARDLEAYESVEFSSSARTKDGTSQLRFSETVKATVRGGEMEVPDRFTLQLPVFGNLTQMEAMLRYRISNGKLSIYYTLYRPEEVLRKAFEAVCADISEALEVTILNGYSGI